MKTKMKNVYYFFEITNSQNLYFYKSASKACAENTMVSKYFGPFTSFSALKSAAFEEIDKRSLDGETRGYLRHEVRSLKKDDVTASMTQEIYEQKEKREAEAKRAKEEPKDFEDGAELKVSVNPEEPAKLQPEKKHDEFYESVGCAFNVTQAKKIVERLKEQDLDIEPMKRMIFPTRKEGNRTTIPLIYFDEEHAKTVDTSQPIIVATLEFKEGTTHMVIDGTHRVFKRLWIEKETDIKGYILTVEETYKIMVGPLKEVMRKDLKKKGVLV